MCACENDNFVFPFNHIYDDDLFFESIWGVHSNSNNTLSDYSNVKLSIDSLGCDDVVIKDVCKYCTTDDLVLYNTSPLPNNFFSVMQLNCRSLPKNFNHLSTFIQGTNISPAVIAVSETWLQDNNNIFYNLPDYSFISQPRKVKRGGGVGLYVLNKYSYFLRSDVMNIMSDVCEYIVIAINIPDGIIL